MTEETQYDVFLSHNSQDKPAVERLARRLTDEAGLRPFLDKWHLVPGEPWQEALEEALGQSRTCAVFIGPRGISPWEHEEMRAAIEQRVADRTFRVIPVLLPGAERGERGRLPAFLTRANWVEFRESLDDPDAFHCLVAGIRGIAPGRGPGEVVYEGVCPYRGLQVFEEEHASFFFGHEAATEWLVNDLRGSRFLAVIGPSGSGKSSLVRAGLVPALRRGNLPGSETWPLCVFRPGHRPLESLAVALIQLVGPINDPTALSRLIDALSADQRQLHLTTRLALTDAPADRTIALVVDQFEEIFTLCRDEGQRGPFIDNLLYASAIEGGRAVVVLTMRADFYGKCAAYPDLAARITDHQMLVSPMVEEELRQAIERPAQLVGLEFEGGLVETLLRDVQSEPGALPLLQHTLLELWERREGHRLTFAAYREIGSIQGAIAHRAESIYAGFDAAQQAITRRIMLRLTQPGEGTEDTRRRAQKSELLPTSEQAEAIEAVIQTLADARLVTTARDIATGKEQVDVSHEALIRGWPRLRGWIDEDRAGLRTHRRLTEAAIEWDGNYRDESYLYHGVRLAEAEEWAEKYADNLNALEQSFIQAGREWQAQEEQSWKELYEEAERQRQSAMARQLAAQAELVRGQSATLLPLSVLLAVESLRRVPTPEGNQSLRNGLALLPYLMAQMTHKSVVTVVAFSPDGRWVVSGSWDGTARVWEAVSGREVAQMTHESLVEAVTFSPDGRWVASGSRDGTARVWEAVSGCEVARMTYESWMNAVAFSPDGRWVVSGSNDGTVQVWEAVNGHELARMTHEGAVLAVAFSPDGRRVATASNDSTARVWKATSERELARMTHKRQVTAVAFSPDGQWVVSASWDKTGRVWETASGRELARMTHESGVTSVAFSPDGRWVASGSSDNTIRVWEAASGREVARMTHEGLKEVNEVNTVAFSPDGRWVASGSRDNTARVWEAATGQEIARMAHGSEVLAVAFSSNGRWVASGGGDCTARVWEVTSGRELARVTHDLGVYAVAFSPDGRWVASGSDDCTVRVWEAASGRETVRMRHESAVRIVAFSPDGRWVASGSYDGIARVWEAMSGREVARMDKGVKIQVFTVAFSPDGQWVASDDLDGMRVWEAATGREVARLTVERSMNDVEAVVFSPDGRWVASGSGDGTARVWEAVSGREVARMTHEFGVTAVAFSPDGRWVASGSRDDTARVWEAATGREVARMTHESWVNAVAFSTDGRWVVSGSADRTARVWEVTSGREVARMTHEFGVTAVAFSPDGQWVASVSGGEDFTFCVWLWQPEDLIAEACARLTRNLTQREWHQYLGDEPYRPTCPDLPVPGEL
jgi:WD40 repeat protein